MEIQTVFVVKDGKAEKKIISVGERTGIAAEVLDGLSVGDTLVVTGLNSLRAGTSLTVKVVEKR